MSVRVEKIMGFCSFASLYLPIFFIHNNDHDCREDECIRIFYKGDLGCCVLNAANDAGIVLAVAWCFVIIGGAIVACKSKGSVSPFVAIALLFACGVCLAIIDPSKWTFVFASAIPAILFCLCSWLDGKTK